MLQNIRLHFSSFPFNLVAPYRAILRRIVTLAIPLSRDMFPGIPAIPPNRVRYPFGALFYTDISVRYLILQHITRCLCDTTGKQARKSFAILSLKASRDMKSIAAGPLSLSNPDRRTLHIVAHCERDTRKCSCYTPPVAATRHRLRGSLTCDTPGS